MEEHNEISVPELIRETQEERKRTRRTLFLLQASSMVMTILVILFFFFAQHRIAGEMEGLAGRYMEQLNGSMQERLKEYGDLSATNAVLEQENQRLGNELEESKTAERETRNDVRRQLLVMDREKNELKAQIQLLEDALEAGETNEEEGVDTSGETEIPSSVTPLLSMLNRFYSGYSDLGLRFVECKSYSGQTLEQPVLKLDTFMDAGPAVLMPERAAFTFAEGRVELSGYGGEFARNSGEKGTLPDTGIRLARVPIVEEEQTLSPQLRSVFGMPMPEEETSPLSIDEGEHPTVEVVIAKLNHLLMLERGEKFRFTSIGEIKGVQLLDVELQQGGSREAANHLVVAKTCELFLVEEHGYVEFLFKNGYLIQGGKKKPFYNDQYRLPIPNIDRNLWIESGLRCLVSR